MVVAKFVLFVYKYVDLACLGLNVLTISYSVWACCKYISCYFHSMGSVVSITAFEWYEIADNWLRSLDHYHTGWQMEFKNQISIIGFPEFEGD